MLFWRGLAIGRLGNFLLLRVLLRKIRRGLQSEIPNLRPQLIDSFLRDLALG